MKHNRKIAAVLLLAILIIGSLAGCDELLNQLNPPTTLTITERIATFSTAINSTDRAAATILENFGPESSMTEYTKAEALTYWQDAFPAEYSYTFVVSDSSDPLNVVVTGTTKDSSGNLLSEPTYKFVMYQETSGNYLIQEIWEDTAYLIKKVKF